MSSEWDWNEAGPVIGWRLKCSRLRCGLPLAAAAEVLRIHRNTLAGWETNAAAMPIRMLLHAAEVYGVTPAHLLREGDVPGRMEA